MVLVADADFEALAELEALLEALAVAELLFESLRVGEGVLEGLDDKDGSGFFEEVLTTDGTLVSGVPVGERDGRFDGNAVGLRDFVTLLVGLVDFESLTVGLADFVSLLDFVTVTVTERDADDLTEYEYSKFVNVADGDADEELLAELVAETEVEMDGEVDAENSTSRLPSTRDGEK